MWWFVLKMNIRTEASPSASGVQLMRGWWPTSSKQGHYARRMWSTTLPILLRFLSMQVCTNGRWCSNLTSFIGRGRRYMDFCGARYHQTCKCHWSAAPAQLVWGRGSIMLDSISLWPNDRDPRAVSKNPVSHAGSSWPRMATAHSATAADFPTPTSHPIAMMQKKPASQRPHSEYLPTPWGLEWNAPQ